MAAEVTLLVGIKASEGTLKFELVEVTPDETTIAEAIERQQNPDYDYIAAIKAWPTEQPEAAPKGSK
jgi:hypothetical protein